MPDASWQFSEFLLIAPFKVKEKRPRMATFVIEKISELFTDVNNYLIKSSFNLKQASLKSRTG